MRLLDDLHVRRIRRQHPYRNLQALSGGFLDRDRAVSTFWLADNLKAEAVEWVEWVDNMNALGFCTQGIVRVVTFILTSTVSSLVEDSRRITPSGFTHDIRSFYR